VARLDSIAGWVWRDLRFGLRKLWKDARFSSLAILTLAVGIAAATAIFSVLDSAVLDPLPFRDSGRLVWMYIHDVTHPDQDGNPFYTIPEITDIREQNHSFEDVAAVNGRDVLYNDGKQTTLFENGKVVTPNCFEFMGVTPLLGRVITEGDGKPGAPPVFAMSYRLWMKQFNGDPKILNTTLTLNDQPMTLVAIMPPRFLLQNGDIYMPVPWSHTDLANNQNGNPTAYLLTVMRLKRGVTLKSAMAEFDVIARREAALYPKNFPQRFTIRSKYMGEAIAGPFATMLYLLLGAALLLLLIACFNVANLLLARATVREKEIAVRASLGASRGRIVSQLLVESFLLALAGCLLGCAAAYGTVKWIAAVVPKDWFAYESVIEMRPAALYFAAALVMLSTLLSGLAPAVHVVRGTLLPKLTDTGKGVSGSFRHGKFRAGLVVGEVAISILMLNGAGLAMRSLFALQRVDIGFEPHNLLVARLSFPAGRYDTAEQKRIFFQKVLPAVTTLPGVRAATVMTGLPPFGGWAGDVTIPGKTHSERWITGLDLVNEDYFKTLSEPLLRGRAFSDVDVDSARHVIVVNQTLVKNYFKDEDPIGKLIKFNVLDQLSNSPHDAYFEIIGVVRDAKNQGLRESPIPSAFAPYTVSGAMLRLMLLRTTGEPLAALPGLRQAVSGVDSNVPLTFTRSLDDVLDEFQYAQPRFGLYVMGAFAAIGLLLVTMGIFSVMAYTVSLQTHDIGVRMALGAQQGRILSTVLRNGLLLIAAGIVIGVLMSLGAMRVAASMFWGVSVTDPWTFSAVVVVIVAVGLAACLFPARRATKVDPMVALRYE
jgi:putative ABC transport system permease protein